MRKTRRGPWLTGLFAALIGAVWMTGQVIGMVSGILHANDELPPASIAAEQLAADSEEQVSNAPW